MSIPTDLSVRQHERHPCDGPVRIAVGSASAEAVRLGSASLTGGADRIVDFSQGGLGIRSAVYYPLTCHLRLTVVGTGGPPAEIDVRVQRATMTDRSPTYYIGTAFEDSSGQGEAIGRVIAMLKAGAPVSAKGAGRA